MVLGVPLATYAIQIAAEQRPYLYHYTLRPIRKERFKCCFINRYFLHCKWFEPRSHNISR